MFDVFQSNKFTNVCHSDADRTEFETELCAAFSKCNDIKQELEIR